MERVKFRLADSQTGLWLSKHAQQGLATALDAGCWHSATVQAGVMKIELQVDDWMTNSRAKWQSRILSNPFPRTSIDPVHMCPQPGLASTVQPVFAVLLARNPA